MTRPNPRSGGALLAAAILLGLVGGLAVGQPSIGFLVGLGIGLAAVFAVWVGERRR